MTFHALTIIAAVSAAHFSARAVTPPLLPTRKIEFLGDSITAGFCNECKSKIHDDNYEAFEDTWDFRLERYSMLRYAIYLFVHGSNPYTL